jgi:hypothetical protein
MMWKSQLITLESPYLFKVGMFVKLHDEAMRLNNQHRKLAKTAGNLA